MGIPDRRNEPYRSLSLESVTALAWLLFWMVAFFVVFRPLPERLHRQASLELYSEDGQPLAEFRERESGSYRRWLALEEYPKELRSMLLFAEDRRMSWHPGVDPIAILRASYQNLKGGKIVSGASTLAMQLARIHYRGELPKNLWLRKLYEIWYGLRLSLYHKDSTLLEAYLNTAPLPGNRSGFAAGAAYLFGRDIGYLGREELASLIVLLRQNYASKARLKARLTSFLSAYNAAHGSQPALSVREQSKAIERIVSDIQTAQKRATVEHIHKQSPHFVMFLKNRFPELQGELRTTLHAEWNARLSAIIANEFSYIEQSGAEDAAVVILELTPPHGDPRNQVLKLRALVGSRNFFDPRDGQINGALIRRSAGSSLKPFVYALAFDRLNLHPWDTIDDTEMSIPLEDGSSYRPRNYDLRFWGEMTIREALSTSRNIPAVRLAHRLGPTALHRLFRKAGFSIPTDPVRFGSGIALGTAGARLMESCRAYASFIAKGWLLPLSFADRDNAPLYLESSRRRLFRESSAWYVTDVLSDRMARRRSFGSRNFLDFPFPVAAKTGTSKDYKDSWTIGYTPSFVIGVWVGRFSGGPMHGVSGSAGAGRIFQQAVRLVQERAAYRTDTDFHSPAGWKEIEICTKTGLRASNLCPAQREWVPPNSKILDHYCPRHVRPQELAEKQGTRKDSTENPRDRDFAALENPEKNSDSLHNVSKSPSAGLEIVSPVSGEVYYLDPHTPIEVQEIPLEIHVPKARYAAPKAQYRWRINGQAWHSFRSGFMRTMRLPPGRYRLEVEKPNGEVWTRNFSVK